MSCCGQKRDELRAESPEPAHAMAAPDSPMMQPGIYFEYTGETGLTVIGPVTQYTYRFSGKGDRQMIDQRDAGSMAAAPVLRNIMG